MKHPISISPVSIGLHNKPQKTKTKNKNLTGEKFFISIKFTKKISRNWKLIDSKSETLYLTILNHTKKNLPNTKGNQEREANASILTINCFTVSGNVAENSRICLSLGNREMTWSNIPLKSCDSSLSAFK